MKKPYLQVSKVSMAPSGVMCMMFNFSPKGFTFMTNSRLRGSVSCHFRNVDLLLTLEGRRAHT